MTEAAPAYHVTVPLPRVEREARGRRAAHQDELVLEYFRAHPGEAFSPEQVHAAVLPNAPLTSVRRAITNLTGRALLEKTDDTVLGKYRHRIHTWRLARPCPQHQERLF